MRTACIHTPGRRAPARCCAAAAHCRHSEPCSVRARRDFRPAARAHRRAVSTLAGGDAFRSPPRSSSPSDSTQMSLLPPPRCVDTTSVALSAATRASPPGSTRNPALRGNRVDADRECPGRKIRRAVRAPHRRLRQCDVLLRHVRVGSRLQPPDERLRAPLLSMSLPNTGSKC